MSTSSNSTTTTMPLLTIVISTLAFLIAIGSTSVNAEPCSDAFAKLIRERNITECKTLRTLGAEFGWNYQKGTNSTTLEILFGARLINGPEGWIAWGVNPGKRAEMIGTQALIGTVKHHPDGTVALNVTTYDIKKEIRNGCSLLPSKVDVEVSNLSMQPQNEGRLNLYTIYARLVLPSDKYNITRLNHVWQVGYAVTEEDERVRPQQHPTTLGNVDSTETIDLTSSSGQSTGQNRSFLRSVHGVLNIIGWGTLFPIGVIIARYFRVFPFECEPVWFYLHVGCQLTGFLVGTAGWAIGLSLGHSSRYYTFHTHRIFGIIIFTFSTVQMLAFRLKPKKTDDYRKYWNMYHHFLGYGLLTTIFLNIFKGINILKGGAGWKWSYIGILSLLGAIAFGLEIYTWIKFFGSKSKQHISQSKGSETQQANKEKSSDNNAVNQKGS